MVKNAKKIYWAVGATLVVLFLFAAFSISGSAVVVDRGDNVVSATVITSDGRAQSLYHLPFGTFYAVPQLEGSIALLCRDASRKQMGYVTGHMHTWLNVDPNVGCGLVTYVR